MLRAGELKIAAKLPADGCAPEEAQAYTRWLATHHYENFNVASWLLPKELHQHFYNLYAYCRWADDLGDEIPVRERALELLDWWERELDACYEGRPSHPVFVALRETIVAKDVPKQPFADLLKAFRQDQVVKRYPTWDAVLDAIEAMGYDTLHRRPEVSKVKQVGLLGRALITHVLGGSSGSRKGGVAREGANTAPSDSTEADVRASYSECHEIARSAHSNFYPAFFLLPKAKRDGIVALYAFMRLIDDVSDERADVTAKQRGLARWRAALDEAVTGQSQAFDGNAARSLQADDLYGEREVLPALVNTMERFRMPARYLHDLISGAEMDLTIQEYPTFERLKEDCYRVAGTVGVTCTHIFGFSDSKALDLAEKLGLAFQLTNIIRDVREDHAAGRIYLPEEDLARYGVAEEDLARNEATLGERELLRFEADRPRKLYEEGAHLLGLIEEDSRGTLWLLVHTYSALLARIESVDFAVFGERVRLSKPEKIMLMAKARFGRHTEENILAKCDRDRRRAGGAVGGHRAG